MSDFLFHVGDVVSVNPTLALVQIGDDQFAVPATEDLLELAVPGNKVVLALEPGADTYQIGNSMIQQSYKKKQLKAEIEAKRARTQKILDDKAAQLRKRHDLACSYFEMYEIVKNRAPEELSIELVKDITTHLHIECVRNRM